MKKMINSSLFVKIFGLTCILMIICCSFTYAFIAWLVPKTYSSDLDEVLNRNAENLIAELKETNGLESGYLFDEFLLNNDVIMQLYDENDIEIELPSQNNSQFPQPVSDGIVFEAPIHAYEAEHNYLFTFNDLTTVYTLTIIGNSNSVNQLVNTIGNIIPLLMVLIICLSVTGAVFYSRYVTKPIIEISQVSEKMSALDFSWNCSEQRTDELGILAHSLNQMSDKLSTALNELQTANRQLKADIDYEKELEQAQLDFFSAVSHELKTPITIVKGQLEGMLLNIGKYKDRDKYLSRSLEVVNTMESMVKEILTVSHIRSSNEDLCQTSFDFSEIVKKEYDFFEDLIISKQIAWHEEIPEAVMLYGDKTLIKKVINNLVSNAIHYSPIGSDIFISIVVKNEKIYFEIENTGVHISDSEIPKLFKAFYRVEQSRSRQTGGSGLGLYIVKAILDQHHADYQMENSTLGIRFTICF